ncbi:MAG TPA: GAF domain-containing protein [Vicinamibacteria bacterium]|nr:GAF domain-containing protein [Vicinamibacteria bacterium]
MSVEGRPLAESRLRRLRLDAGDVVFVCVAVAAVVFPLRLSEGPPAERFLPELLSALIDLALVWLLLRAAATPRLDRGSVRAFRLLAAARLCALVGNAVWYVDELRGAPPELSLSLAPYTAYYGFLLAGVLSFPMLFATPGERARFRLDALAILVGGGLVLLLALGDRSGGTPAESVVFALYALGDLVLLLAAALLLLRRDPRSGATFPLLAACLLLTLLGDSLAAARPLGLSLPEPAVPLTVRASRLCLAAAAYVFRRQALAHQGVAAAIARPRRRTLLPFAAMASGYGAVLAASIQGHRALPVLVVGVAALTFLVVFRQIAAERENARLLAEQITLKDKARFEALVESSADVVTLIDRGGRFLYASASLERVFGISPEQVVGHSAFESIHPDDRERCRRIFEDCIAVPGSRAHAELRMRHRDGAFRHVEADAVNQLDNPEIGALVATFRDVSARRRAEDELGAQRDLLANLLAVARATTQSPGLGTTLRNALDAVRTVVGATGGSIVLVDERGSVLSSVFAGADSPPEAGRRAHAREVLKGGLAGWVAHRREAAIVSDVLADERWLRLPGESIASALSVPISSGAELVGVLSLVHTERGFFEQRHLRLVQDACEQIALALRNAQVFEALGSMAQRLRLLNDFVRAAGLRLDPDAVLRTAVETLSRQTRWLNIAISVPDPETHVLRIVTRDQDAAPAMQRVGQGVVGRAYETGRTQLVPDVSRDPDHLEGSPLARSELAVPLKRGSRVLGVLNLESDEPDAFGEEDIRLAESLADTIAISLDEATVFRRLAEESERLQAVIGASRDGILLVGDGRVRLVNPPALRLLGLPGDVEDWLGRGKGDLPALARLAAAEGETSLEGRIVRYRAQPLAAGGAEGRLIVLRDVTEERRVAAMREDLTHTLVHDLRTPLNSIMGFLELLGHSPSLGDPHQELLEIAGRATQRLVSLVDTILDVSRLEKGAMPLELETMALAPVVTEVLDLQKPLARPRAITFRAELPGELPRVRADASLLRRILENLVANALRHTPRGGEVLVAARALGEPVPVIEVRIRDLGPGIPAEEQLRIFDKWVTGEQRHRGTGLGLAFCRMAVEAQGGRIRVESAPGAGATFAFTLPAA